MIRLALLLPLHAGASPIALVRLQAFRSLLQCSFSSLYKNTHFLRFPGQVMAVCTDFETS